MVTFSQCSLDKVFIKGTLFIEVQFNIRIQYHFFLNHFRSNDILPVNFHFFIRIKCFWCCRNTQLNSRINTFKYGSRLVCCFRPEHMFLIYDCHDRQIIFLLSSSCYFIQRSKTFAFTNHYITFLVYTFPIDEQYLSRLYPFTLVYFIKHYRSQLSGFSKSIFQTCIALQMQFAWGKPYICHFLITAVTTRFKFICNISQCLTSHNCFSSTGWSLKHNLVAFTAKI